MQITKISNYNPKFTAYFQNDDQTREVFKIVDEELSPDFKYVKGSKNSNALNLCDSQKIRAKKEIVEELNKLKENHTNTPLKLYIKKSYDMEGLFAENTAANGQRMASLAGSDEPMYKQLLSVLRNLNNPQLKKFWMTPDSQSIYDVAMSKTPCKVDYKG